MIFSHAAEIQFQPAKIIMKTALRQHPDQHGATQPNQCESADNMKPCHDPCQGEAARYLAVRKIRVNDLQQDQHGDDDVQQPKKGAVFVRERIA